MAHVRLSTADVAAAGLPPTHDRVLLSRSRRARDEPRAARRRRAEASKAERARCDALASQVALALDSAVLSEEVHRRRGEARFASLVRHASDLITVLDADTTVTLPEPVERADPRLRARGAARARGSTASPSPATATGWRSASPPRRPASGASRSSARS